MKVRVGLKEDQQNQQLLVWLTKKSSNNKNKKWKRNTITDARNKKDYKKLLRTIRCQRSRGKMDQLQNIKPTKTESRRNLKAWTNIELVKDLISD